MIIFDVDNWKINMFKDKYIGTAKTLVWSQCYFDTSTRQT